MEAMCVTAILDMHFILMARHAAKIQVSRIIAENMETNHSAQKEHSNYMYSVCFTFELAIAN